MLPKNKTQNGMGVPTLLAFFLALSKPQNNVCQVEQLLLFPRACCIARALSLRSTHRHFGGA
jgi:hypothetical protein